MSNFACGRLERDPPAVQHDEAVGDVEDVVDVVTDEEDRAAARPNLPHEMEDLGGLRQRERRRRLVEDDEVRLACRWHARSRHPAARRPRAGRQSSAALNDPRGEADLAHQPLRLALPRCATSRKPKRPASSRPMKMLRTIDLLHRKRPVLEHRLNPGRTRTRGVPKSVTGLPRTRIVAARRLDHAGEDLDQRRLFRHRYRR